jgi:putative membrane protein
MPKHPTLILAPLLVMTACGSRDENPQAPPTTAADEQAASTSTVGTGASGAAQGAAMPLTGQAFADAIAASDRFELESARAVQSANPEGTTRSFAQMMIRDHQKSSDELRKTTSQVDKVTLDETPAMTAEQQAQLAELKAAAPQQMPAIYARQQVAAHEKALAMLQTYAQSGDAKPLMDFAGKTAQVVSHHLEEARRLP